MNFERSARLYAEASKYLPGGVSSDIRLTAKPFPLFYSHGKGSRLWDVDGNEYIDYVLGQGPLILGHSNPGLVAAVQEQVALGQIYGGQHEGEVALARKICELVPCAEMVRFNNIGSEAVHGAVRLARGFTGRSKVIKFEGHYHGWLDTALISVHPPLDQAGPYAHPAAVPGSGGQAASALGDMVVLPWNDLDVLAAAFEEHRDEIAAVIMEPWLCNTGCIGPVPGYAEGVKQLCQEHGALLIFDEVITGFRLGLGGAQSYIGVTPDLAVFAKAIAAGFPLSAIAGRADVMSQITRREVMHAGTFNSNPIVVAAGLAAIAELERDENAAHKRMFQLGARLRDGIKTIGERVGIPLLVDGPGPMLSVYFTEKEAVRNYRDYAQTDLAQAQLFVSRLVEHGVRIIGRGLWFLSAAHTEADIDETLNRVEAVLASMK